MWERERRELERMRREIAANLRGLGRGRLAAAETESVGELSSCDNHPGDLGTETFEREKDLGLVGNDEDLLAKVEGALGRLEAGTYGRCTLCGRRIPAARLEALPWAALCLECQRRQEPLDVRRRPVEEAVLGPERIFREGPSVGFDAEDTWQALAAQGTSNTPADEPRATVYGTEYVEAGERRGGVEDLEVEVDGAGDPADGGTG